MKAEIIDGNLVITLPVKTPMEPSKSGKTLIVASSNGNIMPGLKIDGEPVTIGVNAYVKRKG